MTDSVYRHMRHPQYSGLIFITTGMLIQWPTLPTVLMWPLLVGAYYRLAQREEMALRAHFGDTYRQYRSHVPAFVPRWRPWRRAQTGQQDKSIPSGRVSGTDNVEVPEFASRT